MNKALDFECLRQCSKCTTLGQDHVPAEGNPNAEVMIIGQSPGAFEVKEIRPFVGPSGEILDMMLDQAGIAREQVYITNALKCHPPGNRPTNPEELHHCFDNWLVKELKSVNPRIVVLVGKDAWKSVTRELIPFKHGEYVKGKNRIFLTVYHPAFFLRRGDIESFVSVGNTLKSLYAS